MQLKPGHTKKKISGDWRRLRSVEEDGTDQLERSKQMKTYYNWYKKKRSLMDLIWSRKKTWIHHILRGESLLREVI